MRLRAFFAHILKLSRCNSITKTFIMDNDNLINELHAIAMNPTQAPNLEYFKQYNISDEGLLKIKEINDTITQQYTSLQNLQTDLGKKQMQMQLQQLDELSKSGAQTFEVIRSLKDSLKDSLEESKNSQDTTRIMYIVSFCLGLSLIISALVFGIYGQTILAVAFGTFGMASIVTHFIADPPARLQESRSNYVQLTGLTLAWFKETVSNDAYIASTGQLTKEMLENYNMLTDSYVTNTGKFFKMMEDLAEPQNKKKEKEQPKTEEQKE